MKEQKKQLLQKKAFNLPDNLNILQWQKVNQFKCCTLDPFSTEPETLKQIGEFAETKKLTKNGLHHEIYLSDFRKTEANKLKTILREPVK